jgi:hypothetical protein
METSNMLMVDVALFFHIWVDMEQHTWKVSKVKKQY